MTCPPPFPTPEERRQQVTLLLETCPPRERPLLRARLYQQTPDDILEDVCGRPYKVRCALCWVPRGRHLVLGEVADKPINTCRHRRCEGLWRRARLRESTVQERAKAGLLAALSRGGLEACHG
jgi:hypothetical protein